MTDARPAAPPRRSVLVAGAALVLAGCTGSSDPATPGPTRDQRLAARVADEIRALSARYAATIAAHPAMGEGLSPLAAEHDAHVEALTGLLPAAPSATSSPPSPGPVASTPVPTVPSTPAAARSALADAERSAARRRRRQAGTASPELARLLASVAACEAVHAAMLRGES